MCRQDPQPAVNDCGRLPQLRVGLYPIVLSVHHTGDISIIHISREGRARSRACGKRTVLAITTKL